MCAAFAIIMSSVGFVTVNGQDDDEELILRVAMQDDIRTTNPLNAGGVWDWNVLGYLYDRPINIYQETDELIPYIAVGSANHSSDLSTIEWEDFTIGTFGYNPRDTWTDENNSEATIFYDFTGVTWHDGVQMTIRDILFSFHVQAQMPDWTSSVNCLKDKGGRAGSNFPNDHELHIEKVWESENKLQAILNYTMQEPFADFFKNTLSAFLLPYHIWGTEEGMQVTDTKIFSDPGYNKDEPDAWSAERAMSWDNPEPVGSGPFTWDFWDATGGISKIQTWRGHFYREGWNSDYDPDGLAHQPHIDAIQFKIYRTAEAAVLALKNNDVDYIAWSIPPTFVGELANEPGVTLMQSPEPGFFYLSYNMRKPSFGYADYATFPYSEEEDVGKPFRKAVAHCIDKSAIVRRLLLNFGIEGAGPIHSDNKWFNSSIPTYCLDPDKAIEILQNAGYQLTYGPGSSPGPGNWWLNPDGSPIGNGPGGIIEILTPQADYDPINANKGIMIAKQMQDVGIYAESISMDFGSIIDRIDNRDFDMYILAWRIGGDPTDYLHAFFHSSNAAAGQNYPGYQNKTFDDLIDRARVTADATERKQLILDAQAAIAYDLPYDVLYHRTNIEAYRSDNFVGWQVGSSGSIYNWQSIFKIHPPTGNRLNAQFVNPPSAVFSNSTVSIDVVVKNQDRLPIKGAEVLLNSSHGAFSAEEVETTESGKIRVTFTAPYIKNNPDTVANGTTVILQIKQATYTGPDGIEFDPAPSKLAIIKIFPTGAKFLSVKMSANPDIIDPDIEEDNATYGFTYIDVVVKDQNGDPAVGVTVACEVDPQIPSIAPKDNPDADSTDTDSNGVATFILTSTDLPHDDDTILPFNVIAKAISSDPDVSDGEQNLQIFIVDKYHHVHQPPDNMTRIVFVGALVVGIVGVLIIWKRK